MPHSDAQAFLQKPLKGHGRLVRPYKITPTLTVFFLDEDQRSHRKGILSNRNDAQ
jgi:hypothetical protein